MFKHVENYYLVGYSFGTTITLEIAKLLENSGKTGRVLLIDGSPQMMKKLASQITQGDISEERLQASILSLALGTLTLQEKRSFMESILSAGPWDAKVEKFIELTRNEHPYSDEYGRIMLNCLLERVRLTINQDFSEINRIKGEIMLVRPTEISVQDIDDDYGVSAWTEGNTKLKFLEGNHFTIMENPDLPMLINQYDPAIGSDENFVKTMILDYQ